MCSRQSKTQFGVNPTLSRTLGTPSVGRYALPVGRNLFRWQLVTKSQLNFLIASAKIISLVWRGVRAYVRMGKTRGMRMAPAVAPSIIFSPAARIPPESEWVIAVWLAAVLPAEKAQRASFTQLLRGASFVIALSTRMLRVRRRAAGMDELYYCFTGGVRWKLSGRHSCVSSRWSLPTSFDLWEAAEKLSETWGRVSISRTMRVNIDCAN